MTLPPAGAIHEYQFRVAYADTDRMGVVYYANYYVLFERGRTELMRDAGLRYRDMEEQYQVFLPAMESHCRYLAPARYDDLLTIRTWISELGRAHVSFSHEIRQAEGGLLLAEGGTKHPFVNLQWKPIRAPKALHTLLLKLSQG